MIVLTKRELRYLFNFLSFMASEGKQPALPTGYFERNKTTGSRLAAKLALALKQGHNLSWELCPIHQLPLWLDSDRPTNSHPAKTS